MSEEKPLDNPLDAPSDKRERPREAPAEPIRKTPGIPSDRDIFETELPKHRLPGHGIDKFI